MVKKKLKNGKQMEEIKHNRSNLSPFVGLTAGTRQQTTNPRSSATPQGSIYYPSFDGSVQYKLPRAFTLPTNSGVYFIHDFIKCIHV